MRGLSRWVGLSGLLLLGCGGEVTPALDPEVDMHPNVPDDAEIADDADVPLLPPIVDDDVVEAEDSAFEVDAGVAVDAPVVATDTGAVERDVPVVTRDVPVTPMCVGSASGQSSVWACNDGNTARERCVTGRVEREACANGCVRRPQGDNDTCAPRCTGSASGQSSEWTCTTNGQARERCVQGRVEDEACPNGCIRRASETNDTCAPRCTGSASGQSSVWTCTANGESRERCVLGRVEENACPNGCIRRASGTNDECAPRCNGSSSGQSSIWTCTANSQARQRCVLGRVENDPCRFGCERRPSGTNDVCATSAPPTTNLPACARRALLRWGLHPDASDRLRCAGVPAERITQTIGSAAASAGTHAADGTAGGQPYSAATDISTRGLSTTSIHDLLNRLANQGFAAWYRWPGHDGWPSSEAPHIHAIYVGARMKSSLRSQVGSWLSGRNGLVSNTTYQFHTWSSAQRALIRTVFDRFN